MKTGAKLYYKASIFLNKTQVNSIHISNYYRIHGNIDHIHLLLLFFFSPVLPPLSISFAATVFIWLGVTVNSINMMKINIDHVKACNTLQFSNNEYVSHLIIPDSNSTLQNVEAYLKYAANSTAIVFLHKIQFECDSFFRINFVSFHTWIRYSNLCDELNRWHGTIM